MGECKRPIDKPRTDVNGANFFLKCGLPRDHIGNGKASRPGALLQGSSQNLSYMVKQRAKEFTAENEKYIKQLAEGKG